MGRAKAAKTTRMRKKDTRDRAAYFAMRYASKKKEILAQQAMYKAENKKTILAKQAIYKAKNREALRVKQAAKYSRNKQAILAAQAIYKTKNRELVRMYKASHYTKNKKAIVKRVVATRRARYKTDEVFRTEMRLRRRLNDALREANTRKAGRSFELIGCSPADCLKHLKAQLGPSQKLADYVTDHIFPVAAYDLTKPEQQRRAFHFSNLQPLSAADNASKGDRAPTRAMASKVERWAWPPGVQPKDLGDRLGRKLGPGAAR